MRLTGIVIGYRVAQTNVRRMLRESNLSLGSPQDDSLSSCLDGEVLADSLRLRFQ